jgi:hypothetical protein
MRSYRNSNLLDDFNWTIILREDYLLHACLLEECGGNCQ